MLFFAFSIFILYCSLFSEANKIDICGKRIIGYLDHMSKNNFTDKKAKMLTHLIYSGINILPTAKVDIFGRRLEHIMRVANRNDHLMVILGLEIFSEEDTEIFRKILQDNDLRRNLINDIIYNIKLKNLKGVDIFWLWTEKTDSPIYEIFLCELKDNFAENDLINVTVSFSAPNFLFKKMKNMMNCSNFMNLYLTNAVVVDPEENLAIITSPINPLFNNDNKSFPRMTTFQFLNNIACHLKNFQKLNLILPGDGAVYNDVSDPLWDGDGMWRVSQQEYVNIHWNELRRQYNLEKFIFHEPTQTSYLFDEEKRRFITIEEPKSLQIKFKFAERYGVGGIGFFQLDYDDDNNILLNSYTLFRQMCNQNSSYFKCGSMAKYDPYFYQSSNNHNQSKSTLDFLQANVHFIILSLSLVIFGVIAILFLISSRRVFLLYTQQLDPPTLIQIEADDNFSLKLVQEIGKGKFGKVFLGEWGIEQVAVKIIDKQNELSRHKIVREAAILGSLDHENICTSNGLVHWGLAGRFGLICEFAQLGDLLSFIRARSTLTKNIDSPPLIPSELFRIALMLAKALQYLFKKNILHRDLAARNCLVFGESDAKCSSPASRPNITVKLSDFGMARTLTEYSAAYYVRQFACICLYNKNRKTKIILQPPLLMVKPLPIRWSSPETLKEKKYSFASEIWSYGILLYEIFSYGKIPFGDVDETKLIEIIVKGGHPEIPTNMYMLSSGMNKILESCWNLDAKKRICINDLTNKMELLFSN